MTRARRGVPVAATVLTAVMIPILLGLSYWQVAIRRPWKAALIARLEAARTLPPVTATDYFHAMVGEANLQYRRAEVDCRPGTVKPYDLRGGTSAAGDGEGGGGAGGFLVLVDCKGAARAHDARRTPDLVVVAGWTPRGDITSVTVDARFTGTLIDHPYGNDPARPQFMLIPTTAVAPLTPSRQPTPGDLPDNHLSYALQWLAFAVTLAAVYAVYLRQWRRGG